MTHAINPIYSKLATGGKQHRLRSPELIQALDEREFLDLLNSPKTPANQLRPYPSAEVLRGWVDEWLDSGIGPAGDEHPADRNLNGDSTKEAADAVYNYSHGKISLLPEGNGLGYWFDQPQALKPSYIFNNNDAYAQRFLVFFLLSRLRHSLAKCRDKDCGRYFVLKRRRANYSGGTKCLVHQRASRQESATKTTLANRKYAENALYVLVAKRFSKAIQSNPLWHTDDKLKNKIATYLNDRVASSTELAKIYLSPPRKGITGKWVAHLKNREGIEKAIKAISAPATR